MLVQRRHTVAELARDRGCGHAPVWRRTSFPLLASFGCVRPSDIRGSSVGLKSQAVEEEVEFEVSRDVREESPSDDFAGELERDNRFLSDVDFATRLVRTRLSRRVFAGDDVGGRQNESVLTDDDPATGSLRKADRNQKPDGAGGGLLDNLLDPPLGLLRVPRSRTAIVVIRSSSIRF